jgi:hypothetical protein
MIDKPNRKTNSPRRQTPDQLQPGIVPNFCCLIAKQNCRNTLEGSFRELCAHLERLTATSKTCGISQQAQRTRRLELVIVLYVATS